MNFLRISKEALSLAMAYVGVLVGAGLSSGQDMLQYFLSFGKIGLVGVVLLKSVDEGFALEKRGKKQQIAK